MASCFSGEDSEMVEKFVPFSNEDEEHQPRKPRQCTDTFFLYFMGAFFAVLAGFLIYCSVIGDTNRIIKGYDGCGNICGEKNIRQISDPDCFGKDLTNAPYNLVKLNERKCVDDCSKYGMILEFGRCVSADDMQIEKSFWVKVSQDVQACAKEINVMIAISLVLVGVTILLLRYFTAIFLWTILIGGMAACIIGTILLWIMSQSTQISADIREVLHVYAIAATIVTIILLLIAFVVRKRIRMVIQLFKETSKAIGAIPLILLQPIATFVAFGVMITCIGSLSILVVSAGVLERQFDDTYDYMPTKGVIATAILLLVAYMWFCYFFIGCQDMIIGGTIASWYFVRNKNSLRSPIFESTKNLVKYHLGSIAFGALIMMILEILKRIVEGIKRRMRNSGCGVCITFFSCIFDTFIEIAKYFSKLSYIMTAMHGVPFCKGGKEAMRLLVNNFVSTFCMNSVTSFFMEMIKLLLVASVFGLGYWMMDKPGVNAPYIPASIAAIGMYFMIHCFLTIYDTAIDTIFLCFCEDMEQNDGISRPYFMSKDLMTFVDNSKKAFGYVEPAAA